MSGPMEQYLCVDLETTGLNPKQDKIIEIGAVRVKDGRITDTFDRFVYPGRRLTEKVVELTGITDEMLSAASPIEQVLPAFLDFAQELPLLGHRVLFDYSFLKRAAVNTGQSFERSGVDTLKLARCFLPELPSKKLEDLCRYYGISYRAHRACEDARATHLLYQRLCREFYREEDFSPKPLVYKVKKEGPATKAQKERLERLFLLHGIVPEQEIEMLTKNEASRLIDRILAAYGNLQK